MLVAGTFHCVVVSLSSTRLNVSLHYILLHSKLFRDISTSLNILPFRQHSQPIRKEGTSVCQAKAPAQQAVRGTLGAQISPRSKWQIDIALAYHWHSCLLTYRPIGLSLFLYGSFLQPDWKEFKLGSLKTLAGRFYLNSDAMKAIRLTKMTKMAKMRKLTKLGVSCRRYEDQFFKTKMCMFWEKVGKTTA